MTPLQRIIELHIEVFDRLMVPKGVQLKRVDDAADGIGKLLGRQPSAMHSFERVV